jgi:CO/xanthine dehydrogenase FAD-binding subunit
MGGGYALSGGPTIKAARAGAASCLSPPEGTAIIGDAKGVTVAVHQIRSIVRPATLEEAWERRCSEPGASRFLAGGIDIVLYVPPTVSTLIDLAPLGIDAVRREGADVVMGAMATLTDVLESPLVGEVAGGFLCDVLRRVASPLQRNVATLGGAAVRAHPWSDVIPALLVLGARLDVFDGKHSTVELSDARARGESPSPLVLAVRLPGASRGGRGAFQKFARTGFDVGVLNCACFAIIERGVCRTVRVAVGGTPSVAQRVPRVEEMLTAKPLSAPQIALAAKLAADAVDVRDDRRATGEYRRVLIAVGVRRCLENLAGLGTEVKE